MLGRVWIRQCLERYGAVGAGMGRTLECEQAFGVGACFVRCDSIGR